MTDAEIAEIARIRRRYDRERAARKEAERVAESKTLELYLANQQLTQMADHLESLVMLRTQELEQTNQRLKQEVVEREAAVEERTLLYHETQRTLARTEALYRATRSLIAADDLDALLQTVVDSAVEALDADRVQLFGIDLAGAAVTYTVRGGPGQALTRDLSFAELMDGLSGWVVRNLEPVLSAAGEDDPKESDEVRATRRQTAAGSIVVVPLRQRDRILGTLTAVNRPDQPNFTDEDVETLNALASQAAVAITNAQLFAEMRTARQEAESANQAKSRFLANMSHELRTPLNGILGYAQILQRNDELPAKARAAISIMESSGHHLLTLINDILDLSKIEAERMELMPSEFHFPEFLEVIAGIVRVRAEQKGIDFTFEQPSNTPLAVEADEKRLRQVLLNVLGNAVKFTEQGGVIFSVGYHHSSIRFQVSDTGVGIAPEDVQEIFKPFRQTTNRPSEVEGTGLGLAICSRLVEMMGSRMEVQSQIGQGTTFWFDLKLREVTPSPEMQALAAAKVTGYSGTRKRILVADDREANRHVLIDLLEPLDFIVMEAHDGHEALEVTLREHPDMVLMDLVMPNMDGFEATQDICAALEHETPPIIAISASIFDVTREQCQAVGFSDYLPKPVDIDLLLQMMGKHLGIEWTGPNGVNPPAHETVAAAMYQIAAESLATMHELVMIGDIGALDTLFDRLESEEPLAQPFIHTMRELAEQFQLDEMQTLLEEQTKV